MIIGISSNGMGYNVASADQLNDLLLSGNPRAKGYLHLAKIFLEEGEKEGIRAQIQHLKAYASTEPLTQECIDSRYKYVSKGCASTFEQLSGRWAMPGYSRYANLEVARAAKDSYRDHIVRLLDKAAGIKSSEQPGMELPRENAPEGMIFVVQAGAYKNLAGDEALRNRLAGMGVISTIKQYAQIN